jgi:hypothetical protein
VPEATKGDHYHNHPDRAGEAANFPAVRIAMDQDDRRYACAHPYQQAHHQADGGNPAAAFCLRVRIHVSSTLCPRCYKYKTQRHITYALWLKESKSIDSHMEPD